MRYDPYTHSRRSVRLPGYDYSQPGSYFVTICVQGRACLFGDIAAGQMRPNDAGRMVEEMWSNLPTRFPSCATEAFVLMPNHIHGVITIGDHPVGADPCVRPTPSLPRIVQWFKTMTSNAYIRGVNERGWPPFHGRLWQRNYYEHIVRDDDELSRIQGYIENNPVNWQDDPDNPAGRDGSHP